jgi:hypothetical protein
LVATFDDGQSPVLFADLKNGDLTARFARAIHAAFLSSDVSKSSGGVEGIHPVSVGSSHPRK